MTTTTSRVHPEAVSGWSPIGPLVSGMGSSLAFTILTGLAERPVLPLPSAFRTCYGPRCPSAQGQSRDLRHFSPMPTRCGNSALRDMAHVRICPIDESLPHRAAPSLPIPFLSPRALLLWCETARLSHHRFRSGTAPGKYELSSSVEPCGEPRLSPASSPVHLSKASLAPALCREGSL